MHGEKNMEKTKIVVFGDSVTQGCYEILKINGQYELLIDPSSCYGEKLIKKLENRYPEKSFELINSGISGDGLIQAEERVDRDVIAHDPDLLIFAFLLNDVAKRDPAWYGEHLDGLFKKFKDKGYKVIAMSSNMVNRYVAQDVPEIHREMAKDLIKCEDEGWLLKYDQKLKEKADEYGFYFVDAYKAWRKLDSYGIDTTMLLCNRLNHPTRAMHGLFADMLFECIENNKIVE